MSQQGLRQASVRAVTLTANPYEGDWHALFDLAAIPQGPFNGRLLSWINIKLQKSFTSLPEAQQALAEANGAVNFSSMGTFDAGGGGSPPAAPWTPADLAGAYLFDFDADDAASQTVSAGKITSWSSKVGAAAFTNGTGITKTADAVGSRDVATFTTIGMTGDAGANLLTRGLNRVAIVALVKCTTGGGGGIIGFSTASPNFSRIQLAWGAASGGANPLVLTIRRLDADSLVTLTSTSTIPQGTWALVTVVYDPTTAAASLRIAGVGAGAGSTATSGPLSFTSSNESSLGKGLTDAVMNGQIAQVFGFTLTDTDTVERVEGYVAHTWGLQASVLNASHPYHSTLPTTAPTSLATLPRDVAVWGASNISGNQDGSGVSIGTVLATRYANPQRLLGGLPLKGVGGNSWAEVLTRINAATAADKASDTIFQNGGSNDFGSGSTAVSSALQAWMDAKTAIGHSRLLSATAFIAGTSAGTTNWASRIDLYRRMAAAAPGKVMPLWAYTRNPEIYPPLTGQDTSDQAADIMPSSYRHDALHCDDVGYTIQAQKMIGPMVDALQDGAAPYIPWQEVYSKEATNQTLNGLVANVAYYGDLTGATVAFETPDPDFNIAIVGSDIQITRKSATTLTADYYDRQVRTTKGNKVAIDTIRILLGTPAGDAAIHRVSHNGQARYAQWEGFDVADGGKWSAVFDLEMLDAAQDATSLGLVSQYIDGGISIDRTTGGAVRLILRAANGTTAVSLTHAGTLRAGDGRRWLFASVDLAAGVGALVIDTTPHGTTSIAPGAGASSIGLSLPHRRLSLIDAVGSTSVPKCTSGTWWEAADYIDFTQAANRDVFRNSGTKAAINLGSNGSVTIAAGTGAGNTVTPYLLMRGRAADRYMGRNDGVGTTGSGLTLKGVNLLVTNSPARLTTV